ncbi:MAG: ChaN family lipoprotein [Gammaproteobacteria bacterium]|jgi:uncharacterized iron-regulated protein
MLTELAIPGGPAGFVRRGPAERGAWCLGCLALLLMPLVATSAFAGTSPAPPAIEATPALDLSALSDLDRVVAALADRRVVFIGEQHDRYEHHLTQLEILRGLHQQPAPLAIGMEAFQRPFQAYLDAYVAGELSEQEMLRKTEYYSRWRFDYRLYAPILRYAREHRLPVVALNLPQELTRKVGREGPESLSPEEREQLPAEIDRSDSEYASRLSEVFEGHPRNDGQTFEQFLEVQLLWDEGMAERAAEYLSAHPDTRMVILAGVGHLAYGSGIPHRLERRLPLSSAVVLNGWQGVVEPGFADFLLLPEPQSLPPAGKLGAALEAQDEGVRIAACQADSPCQAAGIRKGDRVISIDERPVEDMADLRLALWDKQPGDRVTVGISRKRWILGPRTLNFEVELQEMP